MLDTIILRSIATLKILGLRLGGCRRMEHSYFDLTWNLPYVQSATDRII